MNFLRRHRMAIGIFLMAVSVLGFAFLYTQSKININKVDTPCIITRVDKIGAETADKIIANAPYEQVEDIEKLDGIGTVRGNAIKQRFTVHDTMRIDYYLISLASCALLNVCGGLIIIFGTYKRYILRRDAAERLDKILK